MRLTEVWFTLAIFCCFLPFSLSTYEQLALPSTEYALPELPYGFGGMTSKLSMLFSFFFFFQYCYAITEIHIYNLNLIS